MNPRIPVEYAGKGIAELVIRRDALVDAMESGSQTRVGISSGIAHEFNALSYEQLAHRLNRVCLALHLLWLEGHPNDNPNDNPYPDPTVNRVMSVTQVF